jgi:hypothetical protein
MTKKGSACGTGMAEIRVKIGHRMWHNELQLCRANASKILSYASIALVSFGEKTAKTLTSRAATLAISHAIALSAMTRPGI